MIDHHEAGILRADISSNGRGSHDISVTVRAMSTEIYVQLSGELDFATAGHVESRLEDVLRRAPARLVIDLSALDFMDATGLRALLSAERRAEEAGSQVQVIAGEAEPRRLLELCGVLGRLTPSTGRGGTNGRR